MVVLHLMADPLHALGQLTERIDELHGAADEATGLLVEELNFVRRRAAVAHNAVMVGSTIVVGTPKGHRQRWIPWPEFLRPYLTAAIAGKGRERMVFGDDFSLVHLPNSKDAWFAGAVKRVQAQDPSMPRVTPHDLRHTTASLAIAAGPT
ncbi:hypothetical protein [Microbacterium sp. NPDC056052]|uniref:hypothetical protein n=1 Tax=Microbacterium sp. NPDC056052 TaxID=3345695 RepID=UPI0035E28C48